MWDTCKGWWEGKIKVEVDEVLLLQPSQTPSETLQAHPIKKGGEMAREKTMPTTLRMSDVTGGKLFYYV